jgi:hypothetical protein
LFWAGGACGLLLDRNLTRKFNFERQISIEQKPSNAKNKILLEATLQAIKHPLAARPSYEKFLVPLFPKSGDSEQCKYKK